MKAMDMINSSRNIENIKQELYELDVMYSKAKAQVLMSSCPIYTIDNDKIIRQEYSKDTQALLDMISKQHCEAIKALAKRYGITIDDADDGETETKQVEQDTTLSLEEIITMLLRTIPIENVEMSMFHDPRSQRELFCYYKKDISCHY